MTRQTRNLVNLITSLIAIALIVVLAGGVIIMFISPSYGFSVTYGKETITEKAEYLLPSGELRFDINYTVNAIQKGYTVKIVPNNVSLDIVVDDVLLEFKGITDLTKAFDIKLYDNYFILNIPEGIAMRYILEKVYPGKTVSLANKLDTEKLYFAMIVTSNDGSYSVYIYFGLEFSTAADGIVITPGSIIF